MVILPLKYDCSVLIAAFGLTCYDCDSTESMEACDNTRKEKNCSSILVNPRCFKESLEYSVSILKVKKFSKGCTTQALCDAVADFSVCEAADGDCQVDCCQGDLCNSVALPAVSVLLMGACAFVVLYR